MAAIDNCKSVGDSHLTAAYVCYQTHHPITTLMINTRESNQSSLKMSLATNKQNHIELFIES